MLIGTVEPQQNVQFDRALSHSACRFQRCGVPPCVTPSSVWPRSHVAERTHRCNTTFPTILLSGLQPRTNRFALSACSVQGWTNIETKSNTQGPWQQWGYGIPVWLCNWRTCSYITWSQERLFRTVGLRRGRSRVRLLTLRAKTVELRGNTEVRDTESSRGWIHLPGWGACYRRGPPCDAVSGERYDGCQRSSSENMCWKPTALPS